MNKEPIDDLIANLRKLQGTPDLGPKYLESLALMTKHRNTDGLRRLRELDLGENFQKIQEGAHATFLAGIVRIKDTKKLQQAVDAGFDLNLSLNNIDVSDVVQDKMAEEEFTFIAETKHPINLLSFAICYACSFDFATGEADFSIVKFLFKNKVKPASAQDIFPALFSGNFPLVQYLIKECGIDPNAEVCDFFNTKLPLVFHAINATTENPYNAFVHKGYLDIVEFLCECGANLNVVVKEKIADEETELKPLNLAASTGIPELTDCLMKDGLRFDERTFLTPLFYALCDGHFELCQHLIERGAKYTHKIPYASIEQTPTSKKDSIFHIRNYMTSSPEKLKQIDETKASVSFLEFAECLYDYHHATSPTSVIKYAKICIYFNFLYAIEAFHQGDDALAKNYLARAIEYQQKLKKLDHPSNLLFQLVTSMLSTEENASLKDFFTPLKETFADSVRDQIDSEIKDEELFDAIVFEDIESIRKCFATFPDDTLNYNLENMEDEDIDSEELDELETKIRPVESDEFSLALGLNKLQYAFIEAVRLAIKLESVNVLRELHSIGKNLLTEVHNELLAIAFLEGVIKGDSSCVSKLFSEAGIDPNFKFSELDFSKLPMQEFESNSPYSVKLGEDVDIVTYLNKQLSQGSANRNMQTEIGYLSRKGFKSKPKEDTPEKVSLAAHRNRFVPNDNNAIPPTAAQRNFDM